MKKLISLVLLTQLIACKKDMEYQDFTSEQGWFTMKIPPNWSEYDDEEGTYAFFDTSHWTGNFRVTPLKIDGPDNSDSLKNYIDDDYNKNKDLNPVRSKVNDFNCVSYSKRIDQDGDKQTLYYWVLGKPGFIFICTYTVDTKNEDTADNKAELSKVEKIINSLKTK